ncbi:MAG TPA: ATP-binding protein, partial [Methanomicrobiales archaeon]|nr:ATP-binding protein [Methanomicrobiales archaeon]
EQANDALQANEETYRTLFNSMNEGYVLAELIRDDAGSPIDYSVLDVNPVIERMLGLQRSKIIGRRILEIFPKVRPPLAQFGEMLRTGTPLHFEDYSPTLQRRFHIYAFPVPPGDRFAQISSDITEHRKGEEELQAAYQQKADIIEFLPDPTFVIDADERVIAWNRAMEKITGVLKGEMLGKGDYIYAVPIYGKPRPLLLNFALQGRRGIESLYDTFQRDGETITVEIYIPTFNLGKGAFFWGKASPLRDREGRIVGAIESIRDISELKQAEIRLREYAENLKRSNADLELFAQIATHDLQEPIRGIVTFSQILLDQCKSGDSPLTEKYLRNIEDAGLRMHHLVGDLRRYSGVRAHEKPPGPADMETVLKSALDNLQLVIRETEASITHDTLPVVLADRTQAILVFQNLIDNAIKFRRRGVQPEIHISAAPGEGMWRFAIQDNGIGIQSEYFDKIFILFERLHRRDAYPGTGLGLALCKRIVERHGGRIWVESRPGEGSIFYFTLPAVQ